ncbi:MAG: hypothetical protein HY783_08850 [Chloroflexi bacterium]|nr:hypothetical protein [Chloroflexota bacterium]
MSPSFSARARMEGSATNNSSWESLSPSSHKEANRRQLGVVSWNKGRLLECTIAYAG